MHQKNLEENIAFVEENKEKLLEEHFNKYLLVFHKKVIDAFDTYAKAAGEGVRQFGVDENFLVYHLIDTEPLNFVFSATA